MNSLQTLFGQLPANYRKWSFILFMILTIMAVLKGMTTPFYLIYFFWWSEVIELAVDRLFYKQNGNAVVYGSNKASVLGSVYMLGIYVVFIIVFFGFIAGFDNREIVLVNLNVLFFKNWFFNVNLMLLVLERVILHITQQPIQINSGGFSANMVVLHISIVIGGLLMAFVVRNYPNIFTPDNLWGSVVIITPFILLKMIVLRLNERGRLKHEKAK